MYSLLRLLDSKALDSIRFSVFKAAGLSLLLGKSGWDNLFLHSCYNADETLTDLLIPQGVIFLTASKPVFFFLNITYHPNKKQVWGWNTTLTHHHIGPLGQYCVIWCHSNDWEGILNLNDDSQWSRGIMTSEMTMFNNDCMFLWLSVETNDLQISKAV